jgi:outer membrane protein TolC
MRALLNGGLLGAALLAGCGTIPAKAPPELTVPAAFKEAAPPGAAATGWQACLTASYEVDLFRRIGAAARRPRPTPKPNKRATLP